MFWIAWIAAAVVTNLIAIYQPSAAGALLTATCVLGAAHALALVASRDKQMHLFLLLLGAGPMLVFWNPLQLFLPFAIFYTGVVVAYLTEMLSFAAWRARLVFANRPGASVLR